MGKTRLIAETGAGQHGVATATAAALMGMECVVFMGEEDTKRQALNVYRMRLLGAEVIPVTSGTGTGKDAVSEAMREWTSRISDTHYCLGSVMGPHPFPHHRARLPVCHIQGDQGADAGKGEAVCRTLLLPAWAAVPMPSAVSTISLKIRMCALLAAKLQAAASIPLKQLPPSTPAVWAFSTA